MIRFEIAVHEAAEIEIVNRFLAELAEYRRKQEEMMPKILGGINPAERQASNQLHRAIHQQISGGVYK